MSPIDQLSNIDIGGTSIVTLLASSHDGCTESTRLLANHGIAWDGKTLTLDINSGALGALLLSALLREPGTALDVDSGLLSIPLASGDALVSYRDDAVLTAAEREEALADLLRAKASVTATIAAGGLSPEQLRELRVGLNSLEGRIIDQTRAIAAMDLDGGEPFEVEFFGSFSAR